MQSFWQDNKSIQVNDSTNDIITGFGNSDYAVKAIITELIDLDSATRRGIASPHQKYSHAATIKRHARLAAALIDEHYRGRLLMSPANFTGTGDRVTHLVAEQIIESTSLGRSLKKGLEAAGLYRYLERIRTQQNVTHYQRTISLLLASLTMSIGGVKSIDDISKEIFIAWLRFYRDPSSTRWRPELWKGNRAVAYQCLREVTIAFSKHLGDPSLVAEASQLRSDNLSLRSMRFLRRATPNHIKPWLDLYDRFLLQKSSMSKRHDRMFTYFARWIDELKNVCPVDPSEFLIREKRPITFCDFVELHSRGKGGRKVQSVEYISRAFEFSKFLEDEMRSIGRIFPFVTQKEINRLKVETSDNGVRKLFEAASRPLPSRMYGLVQAILKEGENGWPGSLSMCTTEIKFGDEARTIYCPVLPTLFLMLFHIPLRVGQAKRLDSGEGDTERFDASTMRWEHNLGPHAGYWARLRIADGGYARQVSSDPPIAGFYINTNKTGKPYSVPWQNERLHRLLYNLRVWQETWNPIEETVSPEHYVDGASETDERILEGTLPSIFPLFRMPGVDRRGVRGSVPNSRKTHEFWQVLMAETERRWNAQNPNNPCTIVKWNKKTKQPYGAKYNAHGLRVAGITLMLEQAVPIEIVSKLVAGHKTILMTLYYAKFDALSIHSHLEKGSQSAEAARMQKAMDEIRAFDLTELERRTAAIHPDAIRAVAAMSSTDKLLWGNVGYGFCPWDGTRCHDGGPCLRRSTAHGVDRSVYGPVPGGDGNCIMCRHFITGPAWSAPLELHGTILNRRIAVRSRLALENDEKLEFLQRALLSSADEHERKRIERDIQFHRHEGQRLNTQRTLLGKALWNTVLLTQSCDRIKKMTSEHGDSSDAIIIRDTASVIEFLEVSDFEQAAMITMAGKIYPFMCDDEAQTSQERFLDQLLWDSGMVPIAYAPEPRDAKIETYDALSRFIFGRFTRPEIRALESGAIRLQDYVEREEINALISASLRSPVDILSHIKQSAASVTQTTKRVPQLASSEAISA